MSKIKKRKSEYDPTYNWGGNTVLWSNQTDQKIIQEAEDKNVSKSKSELQKEIDYGKRINYWH
ncbi:hypothetical protein QOZ84_07590 [Romboutsia sedimentorum]|uniref:Uncharacterized protein n=1 Tax=Romboutsia sedimentorum TaxID=1368474 RepID=A0ABT7E914_9FIRM|nr:hypothetical protein [Romboutsia sedimentorum]MDK2563409.1 hypothetical protein [Romboutsia sedimentorum]